MSTDRDTLITAIAAAFYDRDPELSRLIVGQVLEAAFAAGYRVVGPAERAVLARAAAWFNAGGKRAGEQALTALFIALDDLDLGSTETPEPT